MPSEQTLNYISDYKFYFSFENSKSPGYITEKVVNAMLAGAIPVFWGDKTVFDLLNPKSFIYVENFKEALE